MNVKYYGDETLVGQIARRVDALETSGYPIAKVDLTAEEYAQVKRELGTAEDFLALPLTRGRQVYFEVDGKNPRLEMLTLMALEPHGSAQ